MRAVSLLVMTVPARFAALPARMIIRFKTVTVHNAIGQSVCHTAFNGASAEYSFASFSPCIYIVTVQYGNKVKQQKIVR